MKFFKGANNLEGNDDLLREILLRLPSNIIFKFTCVSTRWSGVITDPCFSKLYVRRKRRSLGCSYPHGRLLGFLQDFSRNYWFNPDVSHLFLSVRSDDYLEKNMGKKIGACRRAGNGCDFSCGGEFIPYGHGIFQTSSKDGLFICATPDGGYYVGDPITGKGETFPSPNFRIGERATSIGLLSDDEDSVINFRVVIVTGPFTVKANKVLTIDTYSSRTMEWRRCRFTFEIPVAIDPSAPPTFSGGFCHWFTTRVGRVITFDSSLLDEYDRKKKHFLQEIMVPHYAGSKIIWRSDNGQTMWFGTSNWKDGVQVYCKRDDSDGWTLVSRVIDMSTMRTNVIGRSSKDLHLEYSVVSRSHRQDKSFKSDYKMVWMVAFIPWNPRLIIMRAGEKFFIYDSVKQVVDREVILDGCYRIAPYRWQWFPYFHSLSNAKYNPVKG